MSDVRALRTLIVDDEPLAAERLQILCAQITGLELAGTATDGASALRLTEALNPDLLLLDIAMPELDGMAVARDLSARHTPPAVIFVTAFDQFAVAAFDLAAVDYLLKPVSLDRLERALERVRDRIARRATRPTTPRSPWTEEFWVPHRAELLRLKVTEIDLIEAERDYMRLHAGTRSYLLHATITDLERQLNPADFLRVHRSTMVRRDYVASLQRDGAGGWEACLKDGRAIRIGRSYLASVRTMTGRD